MSLHTLAILKLLTVCQKIGKLVQSVKFGKKLAFAASAAGIALALAACNNPVTGANGTTNGSDKTISVVFLPSDSAKEADAARQALTKEIRQATGKKVVVQTTTDYNVAIQAIASGKSQIALLGPVGYIQAHQQNKNVVPMVTYSGKSGTLKDAFYHSYLMVPKDKAAGYQDSGTYSLKNIKGQRISYVSNTSTSGFAIPAGAIQKEFKLKSTDALAQSGQFFQKVLYGGSHQGSAVNLFKGDADVAAFDDMDLLSYGKFTNDSVAGATFTVNTDAPAPFDAVRGKESVAIAAYQVQNEPLAVNKSGISASDIKKITTALTSSRVANDPLFFAPAEAKTHSLLPKDGDTKFIKISDDWYKPTHDILGE